MLPQVGSSELLVIAIIALIVIGPKDLPVMLRKLGKFVGRLRGMANEFRSSFDEMARQSELDDLRKEVAAMRDAASAERASVDAHIEGIENKIGGADGPVMLAGAPYDPNEPESYLRYPESSAEKIINRRRKVAETEGEAKPKAAKTAAQKPVQGKPTQARTAAKTPAVKTGVAKAPRKGKAQP